MNNYQFVPSSLEVKAIASTDLDIAKELKLSDPDKSIAQLLAENHEEKNTEKENIESEHQEDSRSI